LLIISVLTLTAHATYVYVPVTINHAKVQETNTYFPWTVDLSRFPAAWWALVHTRGNIFVKDSLGNNIHRIVDSVNFAADSGTVTILAQTDILYDKHYRIGVSADSNKANYADVFGACNGISRWSMHGSGTLITDDCGGYNGVASANCQTGQPGWMRRGIHLYGNPADISTGNISQLQNVAHFTITTVVKVPSPSTIVATISFWSDGEKLFYDGFNSNQIYLTVNNFAGANYTSLGAPNNYATSWFGTSWCLNSFIYDGTQSEVSRIKSYVNSSVMVLAKTGTIAPLSGTFAGAPYMIGRPDYAQDMYIAEQRIYSDSKSAGWIATEYNNLFDVTATTIGSVLDTQTTTVPGNNSGLPIGIVTVIGIGIGLGFRLLKRSR